MYANIVKMKRKVQAATTTTNIIIKSPQTTSNMYLTLNRKESDKQTNKH